ncbi:RICIN domain-containing protein [Streptomyces sp. IBSBF 2435]|uniref:RICIN domain-containing protein n=1 Tax=Streptomyces sp. IBSBF 2435 TaxID=2903531 RepID=UPI002FDBD44A
MRRRRLIGFLASVAAAVFGGLAQAEPAAATTPPAPNPVVTVSSTDTSQQLLAKAASVTPAPRQIAWQKEGLTGFIHFGPNTYTGSEVGSGTESPGLVQPVDLDTDQWMADFKNAGFTMVIMVAKHHDGMLMFPSAYSSYGIAASSWLGGKGDLVKSFTDSAHKYGIKVGLYLSPADLHENQAGGRFGNGSAAASAVIPSQGAGSGPTFTVTADDYNRYYMNTLYELLTRYGTIDEVWFDGYDPTGGRQPYDVHDWYRMVRTLQPTAVMFGPDVRWAGNENGSARSSEWSVVPQTGDADADGPRSPTFGETATDIASDAQLTTASGYLAWSPAECDARLENGWFWHPDQPPKSLDALTSMYYASIGRNCQLLLDVPPDRTGRFDAADEARLAEFGQWIRTTFATDLAAGAAASNDTGTTAGAGNAPANAVDGDYATAWQPTATTGSLVVDLGATRTVDIVQVQEDIQIGQRVESFAVDAWNGSSWQQVANATTIGYKRLIRLATPVSTSRIRLRITGSRALPPAISSVSLYDDGRSADLALGKAASQSSSTQPGGDAAHGVDGNTDGVFTDGSVTHTGADANAWWQVDLGSSRPVGDIALWNRTDCCADRLTDYWVLVSDTPFAAGLTPQQQALQPGVRSSHRTSQAASPTPLTAGRTGRYVRVQLSGTGYLSLAEVQVFAPAYDFTLSASQPMASVPAGTSTVSTVSTVLSSGASATAALSASGLPAGATAAFSPASVATGGSSTLTVQTAASTPPGDYLVTVTAATPQITRTAQITLSVVAAGPVVSGGVYELRTGTQALDVPALSTAAGTRLAVWTRNGGANQRWTATADSAGGYVLRNVNSGLCADVFGGSTAAGAAVDQWTCSGSSNQAWRLAASGSGYVLTARSSGLALSADGAADGATVTQHAVPQGTVWTLVKVG